MMKESKAMQKETEIIRMMNMKAACELWGVTRWKVYELISQGKIKPIINAGKGFKFLATDYKLEFLERL